MGTNKLQTYALSVSLLLVGTSQTATAQAVGALKQKLTWSRPESEIQSVRFSNDGRSILIVTRVHWPDGDEAEGLPESFFANLERRKSEDPRFADPVIQLIDVTGQTVCEVRYGINPALSDDSKKIAYARQKKPLTGMRSLAETMAGNDIQIFNCDTKKTESIATPSSGYLDTPEFVADDSSVLYTVNEAVNGAMGGPVSVQRVDLQTGKTETLLDKQNTPAVSCSAPDQSKTPLQKMMCEQNVKLSTSFSDLLFGFGVADGSAIVFQGKPIPAPGDMYLASRYSIALHALAPIPDELLSFGEVEMNKLGDLSLQPISKSTALIFTGYWRPFSLEKKTWLPELGPKNKRAKSVYSPDLRYYALAEPAEEPTHFVVYRSSDGIKLFSSLPIAGVFAMTWSRDSSKLAVVALPKGVSGAKYRELLHIYRLR